MVPLKGVCWKFFCGFFLEFLKGAHSSKSHKLSDCHLLERSAGMDLLVGTVLFNEEIPTKGRIGHYFELPISKVYSFTVLCTRNVQFCERLNNLVPHSLTVTQR